MSLNQKYSIIQINMKSKLSDKEWKVTSPHHWWKGDIQGVVN